ncbi:MAG TPA: MFS transporter [Methanocella sp.]|nr:MFS transporter [Methanocella sp.]HTY90681.1 MFS transporter [Methanocella sp.]
MSENIDVTNTAGEEMPKKGISYKWVALSCVTLATLMGTINGSIILISLPAIFKGIQLNPMAPDAFQYLLWILMGYGLVTAALLLSLGRLADMYGRVKLFQLGFLIFAVGSILLWLTPGTGEQGALELIIFRMIQAVGGAFTMANGAAIITDAFPASERGKALGINMVAVMSGQFIGLILGGILAVYHWRYVFLISVPFAILGTIWSYWKLKELAIPAAKTGIDYIGNLIFIGGLTSLLIGITYGLMPYGNDAMGWSSPWVIGSIVLGILLLIAFPLVESRVKYPMFRIDLFKIKSFAYANLASTTSAIARGGVMFMLILLLQGIWLPLHGYAYADTPFWAGIYMLPMTIGFILMGPISGILSDKYGPRWIATGGMALVTLCFIGLATLNFDFEYWQLGVLLFLMGCGSGMFASPNSSSIMNSVPPQDRGVASGMMSTLMNSANTASMAIFFTIIIVGIQSAFPAAVQNSLASLGSAQLGPLAAALGAIPPTGALFSAFLGYNPIDAILSALPASVASSIPQNVLAVLHSHDWFPRTLADAFMPSLRISFIIGAILSGIAAVLSAMRGEKYVHEASGPANSMTATAGVPEAKK